MCGKQKVILQDHLERKIDRETIFSVLHHMCGSRFDLEESTLHHRSDGDTFPDRVELAPARHAMDIHLERCTRQLVELLPGPALFLLHLAPDAKIPGGGIEVRHRTVMQDRKFQGQRLSWWKTSLTSNAFFLFTAVTTLR